MARQNLTAQPVNRAGLSPTFAAVTVADGAQFTFDATRRTFLRVRNSGGSAATVSIRIATLVDGQSVPAKTNSIVATSGDELMGPYGLDYKQADGKVYLDTDQPIDVALLTLVST